MENKQHDRIPRLRLLTVWISHPSPEFIGFNIKCPPKRIDSIWYQYYTRTSFWEGIESYSKDAVHSLHPNPMDHHRSSWIYRFVPWIKVHLPPQAFLDCPGDQDASDANGTKHQAPHEFHRGAIDAIHAGYPHEVQIQNQHLGGSAQPWFALKRRGMLQGPMGPWSLCFFLIWTYCFDLDMSQ
jgi:hypothetical protein